MKKFILIVFPIILSVVGLGITVYVEFFKEDSYLSLYMKSQHNVIKKAKNYEEIKLTYKNREINELYSTRFLLINSGTKFFEKEDVLTPILISLDVSEILDVKKYKSAPPSFDLDISKVSNNKISIDFDLMNTGDTYEFDVLTDSPVDSFKVDSRIKGLSNFETFHYIENPPLRDRVTSYQIIIFIVSLITTLLLWMGFRKLVIPIRSTAYFILNDYPQESFEPDLFMGLLRKWTEDYLDQETLERIESRLNSTDIHNKEALDSFRDKTCYDLLNKDPSGGFAIILFILMGWVFMNAWSLITSLVMLN